MLTERLIARIRGQLELGTPDLEARSLAGEYASLCQRARERLEQCAALARAGNEHAAFQSAEAEPDLLGLCALLSFAESDRWHALCRERGLPAGFPLDGQHVLAVESLYGKQIGENHPLYRDYRDAIRKRDEDRALSILRSIVRINPDDPNAHSELTRLSTKFLRESLGKVTALFAQQHDDEAIELMHRMERFGANDLDQNSQWDEALSRRTAALKAKASAQVSHSVDDATEAHAGNHWEACASAIGRARSLERDHQLNLSSDLATRIKVLEDWAGQLAAAAETEASLRASTVTLIEEWHTLSQEAAQSSSPAILIVRLTQWIERAEAQADRLPDGLIRNARALRKLTRTRLSRRYILLTSSWVTALLLAIAGVVTWNIQKTQEEEARDRLSDTERLIELYDHPKAAKTLAELERASASDDAGRKDQIAKLRLRLTAQIATEQHLRTEATALQNRRQQGLTSANTADTKNRTEQYLQVLPKIGSELRAQLNAIFPSPETLLTLANQHLDQARADLTLQRTALRKALGDAETIADIGASADALERLNLTLKILKDSGVKELDEAAAEADRASSRLGGEIKTVNALKALREAADMTSYLAALQRAVTQTATEKSDVSRRAAFVTAHAEILGNLPRSALAPRVAAMWDAAPQADPQGVFQPAELLENESRTLKALSDDSLAKTLRKYTVRRYSAKTLEGVRTVLIVGEITEKRTLLIDGLETTQRAQELSRDGNIVEAVWSHREFNNGVKAGEDIAQPVQLPELDYIRQVTRFQDPQTGKLVEPLLRTLDRVRRNDSPYPELRAYHLQEFYKLATMRPAEWGFLFSPSAMRDAEQLRRITQNALKPYDFLVKEKWADVQGELKGFLLRQGGTPYADEARFWRTVFAFLRTKKLIFAGMVARDGQPSLRESLKDTALYGLDNEGKPAVLFRIGTDGLPQRVADAAPFSPLLRYPVTVTEAAEAAHIPPGLLPPDGGWETILQGRDL